MILETILMENIKKWRNGEYTSFITTNPKFEAMFMELEKKVLLEENNAEELIGAVRRK